MDFFFLLSGFVVPYSYASRLKRGMGILSYFRLRAERLYPLVILGSLIGGAFICLHPSALTNGRTGLLTALPLAAAALPDPLKGSGPFPLNAPGWSLFYELLASAAFGLAAARLSWKFLLPFITIAALAEVVVSHQDNGLRAVVNQAQLLPGLARVAFPFALGSLIYYLREAGHLPNLRLPVWFSLGALLASFAPSFFYPHSWLGDVLTTGLLYPALLIAGLRTDLPNWANRPCELAGDLGYPLYAIHFPVLSIAAVALFGANMTTLVLATLAVMVCTLLASLADKRFQAAFKTRRKRASEQKRNAPAGSHAATGQV